MTRSPFLLPVAAALALALGACGSSGDPSGSTNRQDKAFDGALKFSKCMRDHGVDFPDPQRVGAGGIKLTAKNINPNDPNTKAAQKACQKYMEVGGGETLDPQKRAQLQQAALKYARCMRQHGVDMPDPKMTGKGGLTFQAGGPGAKKQSSGPSGKLGADPDSPAFKSADSACRHFLGAIGGEGPSTNKEQDG